MEFPFQDTQALFGATDVEFAVGTGFIRGFDRGTLHRRVSIAYDDEEGKVAPGEYALEYLKRVNDRGRRGRSQHYWRGLVDPEARRDTETQQRVQRHIEGCRFRSRDRRCIYLLMTARIPWTVSLFL